MNLLEKFPTATACLLSAALLSACGMFMPSQALCAENRPTVGKISYAQVFNGESNPQKVCTVDGPQLQPGINYVFDSRGLLVVKDNVGDHVSIEAKNGKIFVGGNVGTHADISAKVPEDSHTYTTFMPILVGKVVTIMPITHHVFDGFTYSKDTDPAVTIAGNVAEKTDITSNHGIHIGGSFNQSANLRSSRDTEFSKVTTGPVANEFIAPIVNQVAPSV